MKRWLLIFIFLASSATADSWLDDRTDYYEQARVKLGYETSSAGLFTDTMASRLWNEAATLILPINRGVKRLTTITTSYHENTYALDSTLIDIGGAMFDSAGHVKPLKYIPMSSWADQEHRDTDGTKSKTLTRPSYFDYTDSLILIYPAPGQNRIDTITVMGWHRMADVDTSTTSGPIPEMYRVAILYHMVYNHAVARSDPRVTAFESQLSFALSRIGLKLTRGGQVVKDGK